MRRRPLFVGTTRTGRMGSIRPPSSVVTLWLLCDYVPLRAAPAGRGSAGRSRGSGVAVGCLVGVHDGCVQGARRRRRPPAASFRLRSRPPQASASASAGQVSCLLVRWRLRGVLSSCARCRERTVSYDVSPIGGGPATPWRFFGGTGSSGRSGPWDVVVALPAAFLGVLHVRRWRDGSGAGRVGVSPLWCCLCGERRGGRRAGAGRG